MDPSVTRRGFVRAVGFGAGTMAGVAATQAQGAESLTAPIRIIAVSCSAREGKTTAQALTLCLEAAKAVKPEQIETELVELANLEIPAYVAAGLPLKAGQQDDFPDLANKLADAQVAGIIIGTPVYFGSMTALCKAFLDRCISLRMRKSALANKVGNGQDDISQDEFGLATVKNLGQRVAEVALSRVPAKE